MNARYDVVIVGGGHGGAQAGIALRQRKFEGSVAIVSDERHPPYERPPLSKDYLSREKPFERLLIRPLAFWDQRNIELLLGQRVLAVNAASKTITTSLEETIEYGTLIWATGGSPRRLACSGRALHGVHAVRDRDDVDRILDELDNVERVVIVGGGYIGLEAAAVLSKLGKSVTILEAQDRVLARVAAEPLSRFYEAEHRTRGVEIQLGVTVDCITERGGWASGVRLADGKVLPCEMVIVGIGIVPAVAPLLEAGAAGDNGVSVDDFCRTSLSDIYAIGDCALHANRFAGGRFVRIESVQNANDQATTAAAAIIGAEEPYRAIPWFWSNQYDLKLQTVGLSIGYDDVITRGDPASRSFSLIYLASRRVIALDCVNAVKDYVQGKALVDSSALISRVLLADMSRPLKDITTLFLNKQQH